MPLYSTKIWILNHIIQRNYVILATLLNELIVIIATFFNENMIKLPLYSTNK